QVADRGVDAHPVAEAPEPRRDLVAEPAEDLELDLPAVAAALLEEGGRVGQRAQVVGCDRGTHRPPNLDQPPAQALEARVALALLAPHRGLPPALGRHHSLVIPVGALDEADRRRWAAVGER